MDESFLNTILLTLKLAGLTTLILLIIGIPLAYFLVYSRLKIKFILEALFSLPIVLPPTVIGFYLLIAFNQKGWPQNFLTTHLGIQLNFSFTGILIGSVIYSLPFMLQPIHAGFQNLPKSYKEASYSLGKYRWITIIRVLLPNIKPSLLSGIVLSFAHTMGEFGLILMIGGNIPGKTRVASIAIYDELESLHYANANRYALILMGISFILLLILFYIQKGLTPNQEYD